jgi:multiple sugar transport system substrate-binding protein
MRIRAIILAAAIFMAPLGAMAADLVIWWDEGYYPEEREAVEEIVAAFEQEAGKQVELVFYPQDELPDKISATFEVGQPPDFAFGLDLTVYIPKWALEDRLADLTEAIGTFSNVFDPDALEVAMLRNQRTGEKALYALPMGRTSNHLHVWKSLLEQAGFTLDDIPKEWEAFWAFWCDQVQPVVRRITGRDDVWGAGLPMSAGNYDTWFQFYQFLIAYDANYLSREGRLILDNPEKGGSCLRSLTITRPYIARAARRPAR